MGIKGVEAIFGTSATGSHRAVDQKEHPALQHLAMFPALKDPLRIQTMFAATACRGRPDGRARHAHRGRCDGDPALPTVTGGSLSISAPTANANLGTFINTVGGGTICGPLSRVQVNDARSDRFRLGRQRHLRRVHAAVRTDDRPPAQSVTSPDQLPRWAPRRSPPTIPQTSLPCISQSADFRRGSCRRGEPASGNQGHRQHRHPVGRHADRDPGRPASRPLEPR